MSDWPYLSVVVPAYNEARRLPPTMAALAEFFRGFTQGYEVLIVVGESAGRTLEIAARLAAQQAHFQVIDNGPQRGKGHAMRTGMQRARGEIVFCVLADGWRMLCDAWRIRRLVEKNIREDEGFFAAAHRNFRTLE